MDELLFKRFLAAMIFLRDHIRRKISRSQPTSGAATRKRGLDPSKPGEYPKKLLGHLRRNVQSEGNKGERKARAGTNVPYGRWLELGTRRMGRRPWLTLAIRESAQSIRNILIRGTP